MFKRYIILAATLSFLVTGCKKHETPKSDLFQKGISLGVNKNGKLEEVSGLTESAKQPNYFWAHNDGGNPAQIFLIDRSAKTKKAFTLADIQNRDWEDITLGAGPDENAQYVYVGDVGDNDARYEIIYIYRFKEPSMKDPDVIKDVDTFAVKLQDGSRDIETLMFDPSTKNLYLVSKRESQVRLYEVKYPYLADTLMAKRVGTLPYMFVDGGAISPDGKEVLLRTYTDILYWKKKGNESIVELLKTPASELQYEREPQGEAIAFARDGSGYYTMSENAKGQRGKLIFYKRN